MERGVLRDGCLVEKLALEVGVSLGCGEAQGSLVEEKEVLWRSIDALFNEPHLKSDLIRHPAILIKRKRYSIEKHRDRLVWEVFEVHDLWGHRGKVVSEGIADCA